MSKHVTKFSHINYDLRAQPVGDIVEELRKWWYKYEISQKGWLSRVIEKETAGHKKTFFKDGPRKYRKHDRFILPKVWTYQNLIYLKVNFK